jgi:elongation factor P--beta-lysine ligase
MIAALTAWLGGRATAWTGLALTLAVLLAVAGVGAWRASASVARLVEQAGAQARAERDAHWRGEIEAANALVERARADQLAASLAAEARAQAEIDAARKSLADMEAANAALPNADRCGLGRDRVRLLPN